MQQDTNDHQLPPVGGQDEANLPDDSTPVVVPTGQVPLVTTTPAVAAPSNADQPAEISTPSVDVESLPAEDVDLIEKVWVEKAKEIVNSTLGDPYKQNQQLSEVKAAYIKKRYSKDIKVNGQD
jgi:hypothetical protein